MCILISTFRWVEDKPAADCLIELWSCIVQIVEFWKKLPKSKHPACKSYPLVVEGVQDPLPVVKLEFSN